MAHVCASPMIPAFEMNMTNDRLKSGSQWKFATSLSFSRRYEYAASMNSPIPEPANDMVSIVLRPNVSANCVDIKPAIICTTAKIIGEIFGSNDVPAFEKINDA